MDKVALLIRLLTATEVGVESLDEREALVGLAQTALATLAALGAEDRAGVAALLREAAASPACAGHALKQALAQSLVFHLTGADAALTAAIEAALGEAGCDIGVRMDSLFQLNRLAFVEGPGHAIAAQVFTAARRLAYWDRMIAEGRAVLAASGPAVKSAFNVNNRALILTDQFLTLKHQPTVDAIDFARLFCLEQGREVMILSTCALGRQAYSGLVPHQAGNVNDQLAGVTQIQFEGFSVRYHQPASGRFNGQSLVALMAAIEAFDPALVLVVGAQNLVAELLGPGRFVVQYPTFAGVPLNRGYRFFLWREPSADEVAMMRAEGIEDHFLFAQHPGFAPEPARASLTRAQFGLAKDDFVYAVVGMRLDHDVGEDFLVMLQALCAAEPRARILFVGNFAAFAPLQQRWEFLRTHGRFGGFQDDMAAVFALCDAYLNPRRRGGGGAIVHALHAGLACLSPPYGDAYEAVRDLPPIADYGAMATVAAALATDGDLRERYRELARAASARLGSKAPLVARIVAAYEAFAGSIQSH